MGTFSRKNYIAYVFLLAGLILLPQTVRAQQLPDLVITNDSRIPLQGSCKKGEALWKGTIAIKNIGTGPAQFGGSAAAVLENLGQAKESEDWTLVVYVPQNIDLLDRKRLTSPLAPLDQKGIGIEIGTNKIKRCRFFNKPPKIDYANRRFSRYDDDDDDEYDVVRRRVKALQIFLIEWRDDSLPKYGVDGSYGSETSRALRAYYRAKDLEVSPYAEGNTISIKGLDRVLDELGVEDYSTSSSKICTTGARSDDVNVTVYAVVDPYNQIEELNEANNSATFTVNIDCSRGE